MTPQSQINSYSSMLEQAGVSHVAQITIDGIETL